jgi:hypothetical protein
MQTGDMRRSLTCTAVVTLLSLAPAAQADGGGATYPGKPAGGAPMGVMPAADPAPPPMPPRPFAPPMSPTTGATIVNGKAIPPRGTPSIVRRMIVAANRLIAKRYRWGGGHRSFTRGLERGYDCSGAVSYALYGGRLLLWPLDSTGLARFGERGPGNWVTVYGKRTHAYMVVAGLRFDTGAHDATTIPLGTGPRWSAIPRSPRGFKVRHPLGL